MIEDIETGDVYYDIESGEFFEVKEVNHDEETIHVENPIEETEHNFEFEEIDEEVFYPVSRDVVREPLQFLSEVLGSVRERPHDLNLGSQTTELDFAYEYFEKIREDLE